jgi:hypothetical protein
VFQSLPAGDDSTYQVVLAPCGAPACPVQVRLVTRGKVVDTAAVEWPSIVGKPEPLETPAGVNGVGDPLELERTISTWHTGENGDVATIARSVALGPASTGLLVHQSSGFEHLHRLHYLFVACKGKLIQAWMGREGGGSTSMVDALDIDGDGRTEILYWQFFSTDSAVENWTLSVIRWNAEAGLADEAFAAAGAPPLTAVVAGTFPTPETAEKFLNEHRRCLPSFRVIRVPGTPDGQFAVAGLSARQTLAAEAERALKGCDSTIAARTIPLDLPPQ